MSTELLRYPEHLRQSLKLDGLELANFNFSLGLREILQKRGISALPLIYLGAGGDWWTAALISGSSHLVLVDSHPFLSKGDVEDGLFASLDELFRAVNPERERLGATRAGKDVQPAVQMVANLFRIGIGRNNIRITTNDGRDARVKIKLGKQEMRVDFCSRIVKSAAELGILLHDQDIDGEYGIMAKGGADRALTTIINQLSQQPDFQPLYFVVDDPRSMAGKTLTVAEEAKLFSGYDLQERKSDQETGWGYSWNEEPGGQAGPAANEFDYRTRAVVGIRRPNLPY